VTVPSTAFASAASAATTNVSFSAATASGLEIASQNPVVPSWCDCQMSAAIGSATMTIRNAVAKLNERAVPALSFS
jgi:hypothetical protein